MDLVGWLVTYLVLRLQVCLPIPVAARSKTWVYSRSLAGIADSNPADGMNNCFLCVVCCQLRGLCVGIITCPEESH
jgi:hypothetical protein